MAAGGSRVAQGQCLADAQSHALAISSCHRQLVWAIAPDEAGVAALCEFGRMAERCDPHLSSATSSVASGTSSGVTSSSTRNRIAGQCAVLSAQLSCCLVVDMRLGKGRKALSTAPINRT